jgi:hypothetical protein
MKAALCRHRFKSQVQTDLHASIDPFWSAVLAAHGWKRPSAVHSRDYRYMLEGLRKARLNADLTQLEVAKASGHPQTFISRVELGERRIDPIELQQFAKLYRKNFSHFLP